jgi:hypothetical protein
MIVGKESTLFFALKSTKGLPTSGKRTKGEPMHRSNHELGRLYKTFDEEELKEAAKFFEWATSYENRGLRIAADALRDEGRKAIEKYMARCLSEQRLSGA